MANYGMANFQIMVWPDLAGTQTSNYGTTNNGVATYV